jgi:hypothetical protein
MIQDSAPSDAAMGGSEAVAPLVRVINGEYPELKLSHAAIRAAVAILQRAGFGPPSRSRKTSRAT